LNVSIAQPTDPLLDVSPSVFKHFADESEGVHVIEWWVRQKKMANLRLSFFSCSDSDLIHVVS